jgi:hypothetical protein
MMVWALECTPNSTGNSDGRMVNKKRFVISLLLVPPTVLICFGVWALIGIDALFFPIFGLGLVIFEFLTLPWMMGYPPLWKENRWKKSK